MYAKYNAARILKALKAGEDPNKTNPAPEPSIENVKLDPQDPDVQRINGPAARQQPFVEDVPDEHDRTQPDLAARSTIDSSLHPSRTSSVPRPASATGMSPQPSGAEISPISPGDNAPRETIASQDQAADGGGYFSDVSPSSLHDQNMPLNDTPGSPVRQFSTQISPASPPETSTQHHHTQSSSATLSHRQANLSNSGILPKEQAPAAGSPQMRDYAADDVAVADAQKHAKWAISALNFEDVTTAVNELRLALRSLGAE